MDELFVAEAKLDGAHTSPDISGLIGQYAHGNEPSHHIIYFYTLAGEPGKAADRVRDVYRMMYSDQPDGLSGNEDVGAMSSWYVLSSLGFYQVNPADGRYVFGSPNVDKAVLNVRDGKFTIIAHNNSPENKYIQSIKLNGQPYNKAWIEFEDIAKGGTLEYEMGATPACWY
jgi:predicted alpha-1,2-mannosidase